MLCPRCHGRRTVVGRGLPQPCEECGGRGEIHCCEGLQAQPGPAGEPPGQDPDDPPPSCATDNPAAG